MSPPIRLLVPDQATQACKPTSPTSIPARLKVFNEESTTVLNSVRDSDQKFRFADLPSEIQSGIVGSWISDIVTRQEANTDPRFRAHMFRDHNILIHLAPGGKPTLAEAEEIPPSASLVRMTIPFSCQDILVSKEFASKALSSYIRIYGITISAASSCINEHCNPVHPSRAVQSSFLTRVVAQSMPRIVQVSLHSRLLARESVANVLSCLFESLTSLKVANVIRLDANILTTNNPVGSEILSLESLAPLWCDDSSSRRGHDDKGKTDEAYLELPDVLEEDKTMIIEHSMLMLPTIYGARLLEIVEQSPDFECRLHLELRLIVERDEQHVSTLYTHKSVYVLKSVVNFRSMRLVDFHASRVLSERYIKPIDLDGDSNGEMYYCS